MEKKERTLAYDKSHQITNQELRAVSGGNDAFRWTHQNTQKMSGGYPNPGVDVTLDTNWDA